MLRLSFFILLSFLGCEAYAFASLSHSTSLQVLPSDSLLSGIQHAIHQAFSRDVKRTKPVELTQLGAALKKAYEAKPRNRVRYWEAYLQFYIAIYYLKTKDKAQSEAALSKGVDWLKRMREKTAEDYALLALLQGFSIQFKGLMGTILTARRATKNARRALALDSTNPRAYYVYASNDFHTPERYGGGKQVEAYLLKALSLPAQAIQNDYTPSWGREGAYEMLIRFYSKKQKWALARQYYREARKAYPESRLIKNLETLLVTPHSAGS